jgi:hypothetical protein
MALHKDLPIYKTAYELLTSAIKITANFPRDFKRLIGDEIRKECMAITLLIFRANVAANKTPHIDQLLEHLQVIELTLRLSRDMRFISTKQYAQAIEYTDSVGKQAQGWKKQQAASPAAGPSRQLSLCD